MAKPTPEVKWSTWLREKPGLRYLGLEPANAPQRGFRILGLERVAANKPPHRRRRGGHLYPFRKLAVEAVRKIEAMAGQCCGNCLHFRPLGYCNNPTMVMLADTYQVAYLRLADPCVLPGQWWPGR